MTSNTEQIKDKLSIVDVISSYIKVEKAGINYKARCPFHNEKTPSFFISPTRQSFYCFGCSEKGDVFSFVEKFEGLDFKAALQILADRAGVKLEKFSKDNLDNSLENKEKDKLLEIMETATKMYEQTLIENKMAIKYLTGRGLTSNSMVRWRLGFARDDWRNLYDYLLAKGFSKENMLAAGLIKKVDSANSEQAKYYDTFRNRIVFPIFDSAGQVIAFSGRAMKEDEKTPKYLNSPETKLFYKSEVLYGFNIAKNYIRKLDYTVLVEGQMDLVMSHQSGIFNTVASSGTALTELHLRKLQKLSNRVIIAYDADSAGEKASRRAAELALSLGMETKIASLKESEDPASVVKNNPEEWKLALRTSSHFVDFALERALEKGPGRELTKEILKNVLPLVAITKSEIEKSQFVKKIAIKMRVPEEAVWDDLKKIPTVKIEKNGSENKTDDREKEKEAFIFELEKYMKEGDSENVSKETVRRVLLQELKTKLREVAIALDDKNLSKKEEQEAKIEFQKIQKQIKDLN